MIDALYRIAYWAAYRLARIYWHIARPVNHGALVMIWHESRVLLIKNSYVSYFSLPGGHVKRSETAREAAVRELAEEINLKVHTDALTQVLDHTHQWEGRTDHVEIFDLVVDSEPTIEVDNREVVSAEWLTPGEALERRLFRPLAQVLEARERSS